MMERIILKISGASLKSEQTVGIIDSNKIKTLAKYIKLLTSKYSVSIVIGGGNIWRGNFNQELNLNRNQADNMGMIATIINSLLLKEALIQCELKTQIFSSCDNEWTTKFNYEVVNDWLNQTNHIAIFAGGTGNSFFSTDTAASLKAAQIGAKLILMGKNGVDGVYNKDPKKHSDATFYDSLTYQEIIKQKLAIMDLTALTMCEENDIKIIVFNIDDYTNIEKIVNQKPFKHTIISK